MVLVGVGQHEAAEILGALGDEVRVRHDDFDARRVVVAEGDAEIDHQPLAGMAVEVEVHPDLAGAAQRQEQQLVGRRREVDHVGRFRRYISTRPRGSRGRGVAGRSRRRRAAPGRRWRSPSSARRTPRKCAGPGPPSTRHSPSRCRTAWLGRALADDAVGALDGDARQHGGGAVQDLDVRLTPGEIAPPI